MSGISAAKNTALYDTHVKLGAKIVEFAGFNMPIVYSSIMDEHKCVRSKAGIFDVSHMGEFKITGDGALDLIQKVTINDASKLEVGQAQYSAMCYPDGGIVDDLLVYRLHDHYVLVVNAANIDKDFAWISDFADESVELTDISDDTALIAVQGPESLNIVQDLLRDDLSGLKYYWTQRVSFEGAKILLSRTGYTGELGFELYMDAVHSVSVWEALLEKGGPYGIQPVGLGARDTLRLEKKMCLYGNDITKDTNPIEAGLGWITKLDKGDFSGRDAVAAVKENGPSRKLVGFELTEKSIPRHGYEIKKNGDVIGEVTSGTFSPILSKGIGLGYVASEFSKIGTEISISIRGKESTANILKMPFV